MATLMTHGLTQTQALELIPPSETSASALLLQMADSLRRLHFSDEITLVSMYSVQTGICAEDCAFCAQASRRRPATGVHVRRFSSAEEMLDRAVRAADAGAVEICLVASGTRLSDPIRVQQMSRGIRLIKQNTRLECAANIGLVTDEVLAILAEAGLDTLVHNVETASSYHPTVITSHSYSDEIDTIHRARRAGLKIQTGAILGMGESWEQRVELACEIRDLRPDVVGLSLFQPMRGTPLECVPVMQPREALASLALFRCLLPAFPLYLLGGREKVLGDLQGEAFRAGVNGTTVGDYLFTAGQPSDTLRSSLAQAGLKVREL